MDWYFDFISPFAYLQWRRLRDLPEFAAVQVKPLLFAGLLKHWEHKGPAEIPPKRRFTYRQVTWLAQRQGVPLRCPAAHPFNPLRALRLAIALDCRREVIDAIFRCIWQEGRDINAPEVWRELLNELGVTDAEALIESTHAKEKLLQNGKEALAAGVFGVPTLVTGGELFWGVDATDMALDFLRDPARFASGEYKRIDSIQPSAMRKEVSK